MFKEVEAMNRETEQLSRMISIGTHVDGVS
jgi:hypothetical protein